jgi:hypothetical protein
MEGPRLGIRLPGYDVRPAVLADLVACNALCRRVHGHDREGELHEAIGQGTAQGLQALIGAASSFDGGGFLLPTRNGELFRWCLRHGLRLVHQMTLMTVGLYNEPDGAYLPSVLY